jgi:two-component system LytT family response regulator
MDVLIVDDEHLARLEMRRLLADVPEVRVVGEAGTVDEAEAQVEETNPDLVFLDVQMPGEDGFALLRRLDDPPLIVFATAYDEYAIKAFEVSALDYLVKPIDPARLRETLVRVQRRLAAPDAEGPVEAAGTGEGDATTEAVDDMTLTPEDKVFVKDGKQYYLVKLADVRLFESEGNYVRIYFEGGRPLVHRSLTYLEERLDPASFFRASRQYILNLRWVVDLEPWLGERIMAKIDGAPDVEMSRRRSRAFQQRMKL